MSLALLAIAVVALLAVGYVVYGGLIARQYQLRSDAETPAVRVNDGVDFVPTRPFYLFGQHFSAIAAAGPIAGPILACQQFGWVPCILWIGLGVVFIGAVHDFSTLVASVRHGARSIAEVVKQHLGPGAWLAILAFIWLALIYVIVAFADITANTFRSGDVQGLSFRFDPGGAVAAASVMYLALAVVMGLVDRFLKPPLWLQTTIFVPATLGAVWLGTKLSTVLVLDVKTWAVLILAYCFVASLLPVWALLQPRGYLGGFILYLALAFGVVGMLFGGFSIEQPAFKGWSFTHPRSGDVFTLFPFLFVTIACGACSGFHGLVCSGTTSKQIARETHCKAIGYGAMLAEGFVALIALGTILIASSTQVAGMSPGAVYGQGLGRFITVMIGEEHLLLATTFGAMAFSTFVFDTLDVSTRLGRYILQELTGRQGTVAKLVATAATCGVPLLFVLGAGPGSYLKFWTLFGTSNQLLAALSLLGVTVWLMRSGRRYWYTFLPMVFVMSITLWALVQQVLSAAQRANTVLGVVNAGIAVVLIGLAVSVVVYAVRAARAPVAGAVNRAA